MSLTFDRSKTKKFPPHSWSFTGVYEPMVRRFNLELLIMFAWLLYVIWRTLLIYDKVKTMVGAMMALHNMMAETMPMMTMEMGMQMAMSMRAMSGGMGGDMAGGMDGDMAGGMDGDMAGGMAGGMGRRMQGGMDGGMAMGGGMDGGMAMGGDMGGMGGMGGMAMPPEMMTMVNGMIDMIDNNALYIYDNMYSVMIMYGACCILPIIDFQKYLYTKMIRQPFIMTPFFIASQLLFASYIWTIIKFSYLRH